MKNKQNLPFWLRGGIIGIEVNLAWIIIILLIMYLFLSPYSASIFPALMYLPAILFNSNYGMLMILINLLICFSIGAIISWIYGRVKGK